FPRWCLYSRAGRPVYLPTPHWRLSSCVTAPIFRKSFLPPLDRGRRERHPVAGFQNESASNAWNRCLTALIVQRQTLDHAFDSLATRGNAVRSGYEFRRRRQIQADIHLRRVIAIAETRFGRDDFAIPSAIERIEFHRD